MEKLVVASAAHQREEELKQIHWHSRSLSPKGQGFYQMCRRIRESKEIVWLYFTLTIH